MWSVQEAAGTRLLHHLSPGVTAHPTEGIVAEDDGAVLHLRVGDDKLSICGKKEKGGMRKGTSGASLSLVQVRRWPWSGTKSSLVYSEPLTGARKEQKE